MNRCVEDQHTRERTAVSRREGAVGSRILGVGVHQQGTYSERERGAFE